MTNRSLSYYQLFGIIVSMTIISIWTIREGGMMPFYILFAGIVFLPFSIVSTFSLLDLEKHKQLVQFAIFIGTILIVAPSYSLLFFFEIGGLIIALICTGVGFLIWKKREDIEGQLSIFNAMGSLILTLTFITFLIAAIV